jgi:hypothetical protein
MSDPSVPPLPDPSTPLATATDAPRGLNESQVMIFVFFGCCLLMGAAFALYLFVRARRDRPAARPAPPPAPDGPGLNCQL